MLAPSASSSMDNKKKNQEILEGTGLLKFSGEFWGILGIQRKPTP